jgi:XTP/dITP diphosphohydrolase
MKKILIATGNKSKQEQFKRLLDEMNIDSFFKSMYVKEDGNTPRENAIIKAKAYKKKYPNNIILSDDAGISIDVLNGKPGVEARRWMGYFKDNVDDETWLKHVLLELKKFKEPILGHIDACWVIYDDKIYYKNIKIPFKISLKPYRPYLKGWPLSAIQINLKTNQPMFLDGIDERLNEIRDDFKNFIKNVFNKN